MAAIARSSPGGFEGKVQDWRDGKDVDETAPIPGEPAQPEAIVEVTEPEVPLLRSKAYRPRQRQPSLADAIARTDQQRADRRDLLEQAHDRTEAQARPMTTRRALVGAVAHVDAADPEVEVVDDCSGPLTEAWDGASSLAQAGLELPKKRRRSFA